MPVVKLSMLAEQIEACSDEMNSYFDRQTGKVVHLGQDDLAMAEMEDGDMPRESIPDWQREVRELVEKVLCDDGTRFIGLPDRYEINGWQIMADFVETVQGATAAERLARAIRGKGAFSRFRDGLEWAGLTQAWYEFRDQRYRQIAADWCREHQIEFEEDKPVSKPAR